MLFPKLLKSLHELPFESRKDVASIFNYVLVCGCGTVYNGGSGGGGGGNGNGNGVSHSLDGQDGDQETSESYRKTMIGFVRYVGYVRGVGEC